jgi:peroxiredoxin (alkyl hydroperoxide reductase subunit C)
MTETSILQVGQTVPDFTVTTFEPATGGFSEFSLAAAKRAGRWTLLFFYPADYTFVCATEFAALAEQQDEFAELGCEVVAVSADTEFVHLAWQREEKDLEKAKFHMAADRTGALANLFGVWNGGFCLRGTYLIAPDGKLMNAEVNFLNLGRNIDETMRKFKGNLLLAKNPTDACPAKWKAEGDKVLKNPGPKMVGRVHQAHS